MYFHKSRIRIGTILLSWILLTAIMLFACAPRTAPLEMPAYPETRVGETGATAKEPWQIEWEKTLSMAKKEGSVVVYGGGVPAVLNTLAPQFNKKFGFSLEPVTIARGAELMARVSTERRAGLFMPDVIVTGSTTLFNSVKPAGLLDPLEPALMLPEILDPSLWYGGKLRWGDSERLVFNSFAYPNNSLSINTLMVKTGEIKSYRDLLNPRWKGKILMNDPTTAGTALRGFGILAFGLLKDPGFFRQLASLEPVIIRDQRTQVEWLAKGKYPVLMFPFSQPTTEFMKAGAPIDYIYPEEGAYLTGGNGSVVLVNKAPHPNAARIFINWLLSREGQSSVTSLIGVQSARIDVPTEGLHPLSIRRAGVSYFLDGDSETWNLKEPEFQKHAQEIFGHLVSK